MIYLTCDVHHQSLGTENQRHSDLTEVETARRMLERIEAAGVKATYFVTGRALDEERDALAPVLASEALEVGGHTYDAFEPALLHRVSKKVLGSYNGPAWYQRRDVARTVRAVEATGRRCRSWRNHMYMHGPHTERVLADCGVELCSDGVDATATGATRHETGVWNLPITVLPDHEHLYHAERTPAWVAAWRARYDWSDDFGGESYLVEDWADRVLAQVAAREAAGRPSVLMIHPLTMYLTDNFRAFERILEGLAGRATGLVSDILKEHR